MGTHDDSFRPVANPYIVGNPIKDRKLFFGREDDFAYLQKKITGDKKGGLVVLCGARRSGKTSILFQILGGRLGETFVPVLIDMQSVTVQNDAEFLAQIARKCLDAIPGHDISFDDYLAQSARNPQAAFADLTTRLDRVLSGRKLVLMFDEYELFENCIENRTISVEVFNLLANWMEHKEGVFIVFTGSDKLEARSPAYWEKFLGKAIHRRISFLSESDTLRLIREPVAGIVTYEEGVPDEICRLSAGQPFYTQVLCQNVVDHLNEKRSYDVATADLQQVVDEIIANPLPQMIFSWTSLKPIGKLTLSIMAELSRTAAKPIRSDEIIAYAGKEKIGYRIDGNLLKESLERLVHDDLVVRDEASGGYLFKMGLWREWVGREHSIWQVVDEIKGQPEGPGEGLRPQKRIPVLWTAITGGAVVAVLALAVWWLLAKSPSTSDRAARTAQAVDSTEITIRTEPAGANVFLGEVWLGRSPIERRKTAAGRSLLRVELAGFQEASDSVNLEAGVPFEKKIPLSVRSGSVAVRSVPAGAEIIVDGEPTGFRTPHVIGNLSATRAHRVVLRMAGFAEGVYPAVEVREDTAVALDHSFAELTSPLTISTNPPESEIVMDGRMVGRSPLTLPSVTHGTHQIELRREGYERITESIVVPVENNLVRRDLARSAPGWIVFQIEPYADIYVDGELKSSGTQYYPIRVDAGTHEILLRNPHFSEERRTITVTPGDTTRVVHKFAG